MVARKNAALIGACRDGDTENNNASLLTTAYICDPSCPNTDTDKQLGVSVNMPIINKYMPSKCRRILSIIDFTLSK